MPINKDGADTGTIVKEPAENFVDMVTWKFCCCFEVSGSL